MKKYFVFSIILILMFSASFMLSAEEVKFDPVHIQRPVKNFKLTKFSGGEFELAALKDKKNVMLIFPRGYANKDDWCVLCGYQYVELAEYERINQLRKKFDLEIAFILPYNKDVVKNWIASLPEQLKMVESMKNPAKDKEKGWHDWAAYLKKYYPQNLLFTKDNMPMPFPILVDTDAKFSRKLDIFRTEWTERKVEQNIPTILVINKKGELVFKYMAQTTLDRPSTDYIFKVLKTFL